MPVACLEVTGVRIRPLYTFLLILLISAGATWLALPTDVLNIGGVKDDVDINEGLDLQGGLQVLLEARPVAGQDLDSDTLAGTRDTIERRVNGLGVSEPVVQTRGDDQISVELPGVDDPDEAIRVLQETAFLEIIDSQGQSIPEGAVLTTNLGGPETVQAAEGTPGASPVASPVAGSPAAGASPAASPGASPAAEPTPTPDGPVFTTIVQGSDLEDAYITTDQLGRQVVGFDLKGDAADRFFEFTSNNIGRPMSILVDKQVISSPVINGAISDQGIIQVPNAQEVRALVLQLKAGSLQVPLEVVSSNLIGPSLGQDSIDRSLIAGIIGLGTVALFMILYYRLPGLLSVVALLIYTAVSFAIFKLIGVTLTLAGIAGFILSIGMAVDANVLIFARLKEELRTGRTLDRAVEAAFTNAFPSIRDSNASTLITCAILYYFGNSTGTTIITGFAITLGIGVLVSLFSAVLVSRNFMRLMVSSGAIRDRWWYGIDHAERQAIGTGD